MTMPDSARTCPHCGTPLSDQALGGQCPRCLLGVVLADGDLSLSAEGPATTIDHVGAAPGVLDALASSVGPLPRVVLRDTDPIEPAEPPASPIDNAAAGVRYRIEGEIAHGGMGAVLKGRDPDLGRDVAIKVLKDTLRDNPDMLRRFIEEAQIGGQLQHPGVVPIYELGLFADQRPFFAMKLVKGRTLADLLRARGTPSEGRPRFLSIFQAIAQTLAYAHARGVIHRDLKPLNVMVGSFGEVQVMDWGLAKILSRPESAGSVSTDAGASQETLIAVVGGGSERDPSHVGSVLGTPPYMAPEQARGENDQLDERCDVFALGAVLCEILTGQPAFTGRTRQEVLDRAAQGDTSEALARLAACGADSELIALVRDCLAVDREDRPRDARVVAERTTAHLAGVQEKLQRAERDRAVAEARAVEERRKRKWQLGLAASVVGFLLIGGVGLTMANRLLDQQRQRAVDREQMAIDAVKRFGDVVTENRELQTNAALEQLRKDLLKEPLEFFRRLRERLQADRDTRPEALERLAKASFELAQLSDEIGDQRDALTAYREASELYRKLVADNPAVTQLQSDLAYSHDKIGNVLHATGQPVEALAAHEQALAIRRKLAADNPAVSEFQSELADSHNNIALLLRATGQPTEAMAAFEQALAIHRKLAADNPSVTRFQRNLANHHNNIGNLLLETGQPAEALVAYEQTLAIERKLAADNPAVTQLQSGLANSHNNIGGLLLATGKPAEALAAHERALAIRRKLAEDNPAVTKFQSDLAASHYNIGLVLDAIGKPAEALAAHERAMAIRRKLAADNPTVSEFQSDLADSHYNIGVRLHETGRPSEALVAHEQALAIRRKLAADNPAVSEFQSELADSHNSIGSLLRATGKPAEALAAFEQAMAIQRKLAADNPAVTKFRSELADSHNSIGSLLRATGKPAEALAAYEQALAIQRKLAEANPGSPDHASGVGGTRNNMAFIDLEAQRFAEARDKLREAIVWQKKALTANPRNPRYRRGMTTLLNNLIRAARGLGRDDEAAEAQRELDQLQASDPRFAALDARLAAVLQGEAPKDVGESFALAQRAYETKRHATAARLWAEALKANPRLNTDRQSQHPYNAACAASLAAAGQGKDEPAPDAAARARLRQQAREWLTSELTIWAGYVKSGPPQARALIAQTLQHWKQDSDLTGIRDPAALAQLPDAERAAWRELWTNVDALLAKAQGSAAASPRPAPVPELPANPFAP